jgi:large conductance mechanosensitive channel
MWKDLKAFILRGNVLDLAVGIIIGSAFGKIVTSLVNDIIMPPIGLLLGKVNFSNLYVNLSGRPQESLAAAKAAGAATINYGAFINMVLDFLIVALVVFLLIRGVSKMMPKPKAEPVAPTTKDCPFCLSAVPLKATRCPHCTSPLTAGAEKPA